MGCLADKVNYANYGIGPNEMDTTGYYNGGLAKQAVVFDIMSVIHGG